MLEDVMSNKRKKDWIPYYHGSTVYNMSVGDYVQIDIHDVKKTKLIRVSVKIKFASRGSYTGLIIRSKSDVGIWSDWMTINDRWHNRFKEVVSFNDTHIAELM
jgi:hypothetical protein